MGLHIIAYRIIGIDTEEDYSGKPIKYLKTESYKGFDSIRHSGDGDFATDIEFIKHPDDGEDFEERYYRPKDIEQAKQWVLNSGKIPDCNQSRLLKLLEDMSIDPLLYICFSW
jgi:hypothetical protein